MIMILLIVIHNQFKVTDLDQIYFENGWSFKANLDHSKWAVSDYLPWTCIGDLNRDVRIKLFNNSIVHH